MARVMICWLTIALLGNFARSPAAEAISPQPLRAVLVQASHASDALVGDWKKKGANAVVVPYDETTTRAEWAEVAQRVERAGLALYPWVEVARNPAMAQAHPAWMASPGGHHNDWRRRFPSAPIAAHGQVIKAWPWVPIGYAPALDAHRQRIGTLLDKLPAAWAGVFLNDLQAGPSSCGCGNDQCRWAIDYGSPSTASKTNRDDAAAELVKQIQERYPQKTVIPVWVTECELGDLPKAAHSSGLCGGVECAKNDCWPRYARTWNPLVQASRGPIALALWSGSFRREPSWAAIGLSLFMNPLRGGEPIAAGRTIAVVEGHAKSDSERTALVDAVKRAEGGWVVALDQVDQSWEPRVVDLSSVEEKPTDRPAGREAGSAGHRAL
jgi:hypothetical protein